MNMKELKAMTPEGLQKELDALREQVRDMTFKLHSRELKNQHQLKKIKQDIARILTLRNEK
jgi:ribosomal protein L29